MSQDIQARVDGAWKGIDAIYARVEGDWKEVADGWVRVGGAWLRIWPPEEPAPGAGASGAASGLFSATSYPSTIPEGATYNDVNFNTSAISAWVDGRTITAISLQTPYGNVAATTGWVLKNSSSVTIATPSALSTYDYKSVRHSTGSTTAYSTYKVGGAGASIPISGTFYLRVTVAA